MIKMKQLILAMILQILMTKSFRYKAKLLEETEADRADRVLKNTTSSVPLKYRSNSWGSLEMPLINYKVELKLKWTNQFLCKWQ